MKRVEVISENKNYTAVNVGSWHEISGHGLIYPKFGTEIKGKVFSYPQQRRGNIHSNKRIWLFPGR